MKNIYKKPPANLIINGEKPEAFPIRSGSRQRCLLPPLLYNIVLEVLANAIREEKEIKATLIGKEGIKVSMFTDDVTACAKNLKELIF